MNRNSKLYLNACARADLPAPDVPQGFVTRDDFRSLQHAVILALNPRDEVVEQPESDNTVLELYNYIGEGGITASDLRRKMDRVRTSMVTLRINSGGGDVFEGFAIYNDLRAYKKKVRVEIAGLAASAASLIAMAADEIVMEKSSFLMIHNAWVLAMGDKNDLRKAADVLDQIDAGLRDVYVARTGNTKNAITKMMDEETWFSADEAIKAGFADSIIADPVAPKNSTVYDVSACANTPAAYKRKVENELRERGYSATVAKKAVSNGFSVLRDAAPGDTHRDDAEVVAALDKLLSNLKSS